MGEFFSVFSRLCRYGLQRGRLPRIPRPKQLHWTWQPHQMLVAAGFKSDGRRLRQRGDPTHNTLMLYVKV